MKILLLNQCFWPDVAATAQHLSDLASRLAERGHEVTVICADRGYDDHETRFAAREGWHGVDIIRVRSFKANKKSRWQRAANFASFLTACAARLILLPRQEVVIALTSPPLISWLASWFTRLKGGRLIFWVMDLNPDEAIAAGWLAQDSPAAKVLARLLYTSMVRSRSIVALDRFMKQRIVAKGIPPEKIHVIPPWSLGEVADYDQEGREEFRRRHGLADKFVVMYAGNHSPCHPLTTLLAAAEKLAHRTDIVFCFVGGGSEFATVKEFAAGRGLETIVCLPYQPLSQLASVLSAADLHAVVMGNPFVGIVHPSKIYNVLQVRAPFLCVGPPESHITDIVDNMSDAANVYLAKHGEVDRVVEQVVTAANRTNDDSRAGAIQFSPGDSLHEMLNVVEEQSPSQLPAVEGYVVEDTVTNAPAKI
jgi:colanic acid biosynthesis glycosyl transferase WcaI